MGVIIRQSVLTSLISYIGVVIGYVNLLYLYPKFLEPEQIGLLRTVQDAAMLFTPFAVFGLGQGIIKFYPHFSADQKHANNFITLILTLSLITYGIFIVIFLFFQNFFISFFTKNAPNIIQYIPFILWLTFLLLFITLLEQYSRSLLNVAFPAFLREIGIRLLQGILVSIYFLKWITFDQFLLLSVLIFLIVLLILAFYLFRKGQLTIRFDRKTISGSKFKEILIFSGLSFVGTSAMILIGKMDSVMVTGMIGLASNAIYTTAFYMATVIEIPKRAITVTASTMIARAFERNDLKDVQAIYRKTAVNQFIIGSLLLIGIWANLPAIFSLMPKGEIYQAGTYVVMIVGCGKLLDMLFGPSSEIIGLSKYYWFNLLVITILAGVVIVSNYFLIPRLGIEGAAYSTLLALVIYNISKYFFIYYTLGLQPFNFNTLKVFAIGIATAAMNMILPSVENIFADMGYRSVLITLTYASLILIGKASDEISSVFYDVAKNVRQRMGIY
jgi:O-antigen/teichoic acid export membrane protein